ncbi:MAG: sterol desaturase family protein [Anaerolineaceae bacterium]|nr:sterol desaturase family protein [Anaerolineaceae bacterium]
MAHLPVDHSDVPIRLFKSDFLEFFTHISPLAVIILWVPVLMYFLITAVLRAPAGAFPFFIPISFLAGLFLWTLAEYTLHRFVFHFEPKSEQAKRIVFLFHGIHHAQPQIKTRLVMPPIVSIPLALVFYGLFSLVLGLLFKMPQWIGPTFAGFIVGYLAYDLTHYATHHFPMRSGAAKFLKRYHMLHHYKTPDKRFGVSSPLWDYVFGTSDQKTSDQ